MVEFFNIGLALQHGPVLYVGKAIRVIDKVDQGYIERNGQLFGNLD